MTDQMLGGSPAGAEGTRFTNNDAVAARLYPQEADKEAPIKPQFRETTAADALYGASSYSDLPIDGLADAYDVSRQDREGLRREVRQVCTDLDLSDRDARELVRLVAEGGRSPASPEQTRRWERQIENELARTYGKDWESELRHAKQFLNRTPGWRRILDNSGYGSHPRVVEIVVAASRSARGRGR